VQETLSRHQMRDQARLMLCIHTLACSKQAGGRLQATAGKRGGAALTTLHVVCLLLQLLGALSVLPSRPTLWQSGCWIATVQGPSVTSWQVCVSLTTAASRDDL
jgi:hypothetical protein